MANSGNLLLTIAQPGWRDKRDVQVLNVAASWEVSTIGLLSAMLPARRAHLLGIGELLGKWVRADLGRQGIWGGIIQRTPTETNDGTMELSCDSFHTLFKGIATSATYRQAAAPAGALWLRAISDAPSDRARWLNSVKADEDGATIAMEWRGEATFAQIAGAAFDQTPAERVNPLPGGSVPMWGGVRGALYEALAAFEGERSAFTAAARVAFATVYAETDGGLNARYIRTSGDAS